MVEMEKALLKKICRDLDLYVTPSVNDKLYLHYRGFRSIKNLDEYVNLKVLWLEGNGLYRIEGLENQTQLRTLYLHENLIQKVEGLESLLLLDTLNLAQNQISRIENLGHLKQLTSLSLKSNYLTSAQDVEHVLQLPNLAVLDIQGNRITDVNIVDVLAKMPNLKVLYLQGNDVVKHIKQYRKTLVYRCRNLKYLDDRPVFEDERRRVDAWGRALDASNGDLKAAQEAECHEMEAIRREKKERDEMNFRHFEELMIEGRKKRREEEERKKAAAAVAAAPEEEPEEVNPFSGEKIVPVQDCEFLQRERERRWAEVVNEPDNQQDEATQNAAAANQTRPAIPVDERRMEILHQCATVGSGVSRDPFVEESFRVQSPTATPMPPPAPVVAARTSTVESTAEHQQRIKDKAHAKVQELRDKKSADVIAPATHLVVAMAGTEDASEDESTGDIMSDIPPLLVETIPTAPPPAPATVRESASQVTNAQTSDTHTNVDELD
ncbi:TPA: hypothetical protein N0F65_007016 [Lagenidium giganteum]|uniref:Dynein assembly factor 1, axonemal homolog n=1 Tax=Lagenidium giganteum TaxID=4803 RepID=A0AAV2ZKN0_9STRA|nr:TPA: hypothetical protein N0F65_007016 [Lagenidium giganteum]